MYNNGFYPTPAFVAEKMLSFFSSYELKERYILEPSAGKGDIIDAVYKKMSGQWNSYTRTEDYPVYCCEIEPELQATLRGKDYVLVGEDFLNFVPSEIYDLILMNPPFASADKHLLKAWDILPYGDIVCLLNSQTILNPTTTNEKLLEHIISEHGEVEHLGSCFTDAFRKTNVEVTLVHLKKEADPIKFHFTEGLEQDASNEDGTYTLNFGSDLATKDTIGNIVLCYEKAVELQRVKAPLEAEQRYYESILNSGQDSGIKNFNSSEDLTKEFNKFVYELKKSAWSTVFNMTGARNLMSSSVAQDFDRQRNELMHMAFNEHNIKKFLLTLYENRNKILRDCIIEAFDTMTGFDEKNKNHKEGWKTNDSWRVNRRVIGPWCVEYSPQYRHTHFRWGAESKLNDIDRGLAYLEGKKLDEISTIVSAVRAHIKKDNWWGVPFESEYFELKAFKKGTLHLYFKSKSLWERFNMEAAKGKNWLPEDYKWQNASAKDGAVDIYEAV